MATWLEDLAAAALGAAKRAAAKAGQSVLEDAHEGIEAAKKDLRKFVEESQEPPRKIEVEVIQEKPEK